MREFPHAWVELFFVGEWLIRLGMLIVVPFRRTPEAAKGWLLLVFFEPLLGLALYLAIGRPRPPAWRAARFAELPAALRPTVDRLRAHPNVFHPDLGHGLAQTVALSEGLSSIPILGGNQVEVLSDYGGIVDRLVGDIDGALDHVHLLFYIFADDATASRVIEALRRAVKRGVRCRVLVDAMGSKSWTPRLLPHLRALGVEVKAVLPVGLFRRKAGRMDLRNHRKVAVVDGRIGYTGSLNLVAPDFKPGLTYEELMVRIMGPAVLALQYVFLADWFVETGELLDGPGIMPDPDVAGSVAIQALPSGPLYPRANTRWLIVSLAHAARRRLVITTPYLIPDEPLILALKTAVLRGVEVHLVVPAQDDQLLVCLAQKSYYGELLEAGIRIHRYRSRFLHAKHVTVDETISWVGSSNMDVRSFVLNEEIVVLMFGAQVSASLQREQERYFAESESLSAELWEARPLATKVVQNLARLMSPLL